MNKLLCLVIGVMMLGVVSAVSGVVFNNPEEGDYISEDINIDWDNTESITGLTLQHKEGTCSGSTGWVDLKNIDGSTPTEYSWDISDVDDGTQCLRLRLGTTDYAKTGEFIIDREEPTAEITDVSVGDEHDGEVIIEIEIEDENEIESCEIDWGDGEDDSCPESNGEHTLTHTYDESGLYDITLTVEDMAGNEEEDKEEDVNVLIFDAIEMDDMKAVVGVEFEYETEVITGLTDCALVSPDFDEIVVVDTIDYTCKVTWTPTSEQRGEHEVVIKATNGGEEYYSSIVSVYNWEIELLEDELNMFSIPLIPESTKIYDVLEESVSDDVNIEKGIWSYQKGAWKYNIPTATGWKYSSGSDKILEIVPGYGYIIFMDDTVSVYGSGKELGQDVPPEVTLTTGWNLIGHYGENTLDIIGDYVFSSLWLGFDDYWNSVLTVNGDGEFESVDELEPTEAYWLSIKSLNLADGEKRYFSYMPSPECY